MEIEEQRTTRCARKWAARFNFPHPHAPVNSLISLDAPESHSAIRSKTKGWQLFWLATGTCPTPCLADSLPITMSSFCIRLARLGDQAAAYYVCLRTGDHGRDGEPFYHDDPDCAGANFCGSVSRIRARVESSARRRSGRLWLRAAAVLDSRTFYARYDHEWRPRLCEQFPPPFGDPAVWTRAATVHSWYHQPDYFCPEPYQTYPSHMHIDLLERARGQGNGRRMMEQLMGRSAARLARAPICE